MLAAREKHKDAVKLLLNAGAQVDIKNYEQMTASDVTLDADIESLLEETSHLHMKPSNTKENTFETFSIE